MDANRMGGGGGGGSSGSGDMLPVEYDEIMNRNRTVFNSAISRAMSDAAAGNANSAIETLQTAMTLIRQSKVGSSDACKTLLSTLQVNLLPTLISFTCMLVCRKHLLASTTSITNAAAAVASIVVVLARHLSVAIANINVAALVAARATATITRLDNRDVIKSELVWPIVVFITYCARSILIYVNKQITSWYVFYFLTCASPECRWRCCNANCFFIIVPSYFLATCSPSF